MKSTLLTLPSVSHEVLYQKRCVYLDLNNSGGLSYAELVQTFTTEVPTDPDARAFLTAFVCSLNAEVHDEWKTGHSHAKIDTSGWRVTGRDAATVRNELQAILVNSGALVADVMALFDADGDALHVKIDIEEFENCMRKTFGYTGPESVLDQIFDGLDVDKSGEIGFEELFEFLRGKRHSLVHREKELRAEFLKAEPYRLKLMMSFGGSI